MIFQVVHNIDISGIKCLNTNPTTRVTFLLPLSPISHLLPSLACSFAGTDKFSSYCYNTKANAITKT